MTTDNLTLGLNYSYTNAEYDGELPADKAIVDTTNGDAPVGVFTAEERKFNIDGEPLQRIPKNKATGWAEYTWRMGDRGNVVAMTSVSYTDEFGASGSPRQADALSIAPEYIRWDARVSWASASEQWTVTGFVNNILNDVGIRQMDRENGFRNNVLTVEPTNPRMAGLEVQYKFGAFK